MPEELVFYDCKIVVNDKDAFSGVVLEPGVNNNLFYYSKDDVARFVLQLPKVPLVKDHGLTVKDSVGWFSAGSLREDGAAIGHFHISNSEPEILAKVKDGTIKNLSVAHTRGTAQFCSICSKPVSSKECEHVPGSDYNGVKCGIGFKDPQLVHVSLVQMGAGPGCSIVQNEIDAKIRTLVDEIKQLKLIQSTQADELAKSKTELERVRAVRIPEPQGKIKVSAPAEPKKRTIGDELGVS
jgi:hypothetical protein